MPSANAKHRDRIIIAALSKLALHYWRPGFSPEQAKLVMHDFLTDLEGYSTQQITDACSAYRRDPECKFFPTPGAIIGKIKSDFDYTPPSRRRYRAATAVPPGVDPPIKLRDPIEIIRELRGEAAAQRLHAIYVARGLTND